MIGRIRSFLIAVTTLFLLICAPIPSHVQESSITYGQSVAGSISTRNPEEIWTFEGRAGDVVEITVDTSVDEISAGLSSQQSPTVCGPEIVPVDSCRWDVWFSLSGFAPNSPITVTNSFSQVTCEGRFDQRSWTVTEGPTDSRGNLRIGYIHGGPPPQSHDFTFEDTQGAHVSLSFSYTGSSTASQCVSSTSAAFEESEAGNHDSEDAGLPSLSETTPPPMRITFDPRALLPADLGSMCVQPLEESAGSALLFDLIPTVHAARSTGFDEAECTSLLDEIYTPITRQCLNYGADGGMWDDQFGENCPDFEIQNSPAVGDIAVWESSAAGNEYGHVAVVERVNDDGTFDVHERNISPTARNTCGEGRRCGLQPQEGISFIRIICSIEPIPLIAPNAPSYLVVPKGISPDNTKNVFVYYDTGRGIWDGVQFPNVSRSDDATLFFVDGTWQAEHPGWTEFRWNYVHICSGQ